MRCLIDWNLVMNALCWCRPALSVAPFAQRELLTLKLAENPPAMVVAPVLGSVAVWAPSPTVTVALSA